MAVAMSAAKGEEDGGADLRQVDNHATGGVEHCGGKAPVGGQAIGIGSSWTSGAKGCLHNGY
ncbi:hypothetical protein CRG98_042071 [Punica granatum]|uniref:Uncharacterized protein n=1 Tax=Punica granatum TaxID=22663 RepID=A0A2I0I0P7_PUNGR|nr:hypothetical protein CRG98_042071 [Punica granatum]